MRIEKPSHPSYEGAEESEFVINPERGTLVSEGQEYTNSPRMREFFRRAKAIRESLPPLSNELVRLWRGNRIDEIGQNPSFTNSLEGIALPFRDAYEGKLSYVDVPRADVEQYLCKSGSAPGSEFLLPPELASKAIAIEEPS